MSVSLCDRQGGRCGVALPAEEEADDSQTVSPLVEADIRFGPTTKAKGQKWVLSAVS